MGKSSYLRLLQSGVALLAVTLVVQQANAAEVAVADGDTPPGEIIVTANKREQKINDVGLAISALGADTMKSQNIVSLADIAGSVPGLSYTPSATQTPVYTLRGVGFYESSLAAYPTTSIYVDEVALPFPAMTTHSNFDLERIEVLKGPQGTLFGQNSTGGAINFIAAKPTRHFEAGADLTYGRFNRVEGNAYISGPITDTVRGRIAFTGARSDDWQYSYTRPGDTNGGANYYGGRILLDWDASSRLKFNLALNGWRDKSQPQAAQYQTLLSQAPAYTPQALRDFPFAPDNARAADWNSDRPPHADNRFYQASLRANWEAIDGVMLTSITSYADLKINQGFDTDGTPFSNDDFFSDLGRIKTFLQEVRLTNTNHSRLRWVIGVNYERSHVYEDQTNDFSESATAAIFFFTGGHAISDQRMRNIAGFGNLEFDVTSKLTAKGGLRYTSARRTDSSCLTGLGDGTLDAAQYGAGAAIQLGYVPIPGYTATGTVLPNDANGCLALDNVTSDGTPADFHSGQYYGTLQEHNVSWRVGLDYKLDRNNLLYMNVAKGYKAGSFPTVSGATFEEYLPVTQESLLSYEAGFKLQTADHTLALDGAVFYYDYRNKQLRGKIIDPLFGVLDALVNIPKSRMIGGELQATFRPTRGLIATLSGAYLDSKIQNYVGLNTAGQPFSYAGAPIPYTPKIEVRATADYNWEWGQVRPFIGASISMRDKTNANIGGSSGLIVTPDFASSVAIPQTYVIPSHTLIDLRAGLSGPDDKWKITVFGKNVFNQFYLTNIYTDYDTIDRFTGMPSTWGIQLSTKFR